MKRLLIIASIILLTACANTAPKVSMSFPDVPDDLKVACPDLAPIPDNTTKLSDAISVVGANYSTYYECKLRVDSWNEWYNTQKDIFDSVK